MVECNKKFINKNCSNIKAAKIFKICADLIFFNVTPGKIVLTVSYFHCGFPERPNQTWSKCIVEPLASPGPPAGSWGCSYHPSPPPLQEAVSLPYSANLNTRTYTQKRTICSLFFVPVPLLPLEFRSLCCSSSEAKQSNKLRLLVFCRNRRNGFIARKTSLFRALIIALSKKKIVFFMYWDQRKSKRSNKMSYLFFSFYRVDDNI